MNLARATGQAFAIGDHDRHIMQAVRDLALAWPTAPVALKLTGPAGGSWLIGSGEPAAVIRAEARPPRGRAPWHAATTTSCWSYCPATTPPSSPCASQDSVLNPSQLAQDATPAAP